VRLEFQDQSSRTFASLKKKAEALSLRFPRSG